MIAMKTTNPGRPSGPRTLAVARGSIFQDRSGGERRKRSVPMHPEAAAKSTAVAGEAAATKSATSIGPTIKISSINTDSSEYAVASKASSFSRCLKYVRMHTVIGGNVAPAAAAKIRIRAGGDRVSTPLTSAENG